MISIIIPTKNEERNLPDLLRSLRNQNQPPRSLEILIVDGKSTDRTREIAKNYGCRVILQKKLGISNARNLGWKNARGDILVFLEADNRVERNFLRKIDAFFKRHKNAKCATCIIVEERKNWIQKTIHAQIQAARKMKTGVTFPIIFRKEVFKKIGGWDEDLDFKEDVEFAKRVERKYKIFRIYTKVYIKHVTSLRKIFNQGRWYGRGILKYLAKTKDLKTFLSFLFFSIFPIGCLLLTPMLTMLNLFFLLIYLFLIFILYPFICFLKTKLSYSFLIPIVNLVRGVGEFVGMVEGFFVKERGKLRS